MKKNSMTLILAAFIITATVLLSGCQPALQDGQTNVKNVNLQSGTFADQPVFVPNKTITTNNFKSEEELLAFIRNNANGGNYYGGGAARGMMEKAVSSIAPMAADTATGAVGGDYSNTNNQVAAVDEADIIKTDGSYIYTVSGQTLFILKAYPGEEAEIVSTIKFKNSYPQGLFISGNKLAVFGGFNDLDFFRDINFRPRQGMTFFSIYDIRDKANPELAKDYKFEGSYFQARMTGNDVYFVTNTMPEFRKDHPTPVFVDGKTIGSVAVADVYYFNLPYDSAQFATVNAIDMESMEKQSSKTITVENSQNMYMSEENIFITYTKYINEWQIRNKATIDLMEDKVNDADKEVIAKIKATDNEVLSQPEKESKILQIIYSYINFMTEDERSDLENQIEEAVAAELEKFEYNEYTVINRIAVKDGNVDVAANGQVPGHIINQFSLDEDKSVLRIATTVSARWRPIYREKMAADIAVKPSEPEQSSNNIYTLDADLKIMDSLTGIEKGEQIYSTRFIGDRLYMVTYRQIDPFFVIDLAEPKDIKILGELKIPGFSRYLHPYDENTIIGIGRDATATGQTKGLKISLFDVRDFENPKEVAKFVTSERYAQSTAEYEHKAFLFSKEKNLLVIPGYNYEYRYYDGTMPRQEAGDGFNGAMVFEISKDKIEMRGIVDHAQGQNSYGPLVERSLYINDLLYTKSAGLLRINKISDLAKVKNIELAGAGSAYPIY